VLSIACGGQTTMNQNQVCIQLKIILYCDFLLIYHHHHHHHHHHHYSLAAVLVSPEFSYPKIIFPITVS